MNAPISRRSALAALAVGACGAAGGCGCGTKPTPITPSDNGERDGDAPFEEAANRVALVVGVNDYRAVRKLHGCANDANNMRELLVTRYGFPPGNVKILTDGEATREGLLKAFREFLIGHAKADTVVVFHFSGHGSRMKDPAGKTPSGMIGTILPVDSRTAGVFDINADELRGLFGELTRKTKNVTFVLDSCHSGLVLKDVAESRSVDSDERVPPPPAPGAAKGVEGFTGSDYALVSACRADEVAFEYEENGAACGTLTRFLVGELRAVGIDKVTYRDVMDKVKARVTGVYRSQHPQLEGANMDNLVFTTKAMTTQPFVLAGPQGEGVALEAGQVHGVTVGSVYDVYPPGTKALDDPAKAVARVEVTAVEPARSTAKRVRGGPVQQASRAVERQRNYGRQRVRVYFDEKSSFATLNEVRATLQGNTRTDPTNRRSPALAQVFDLVAGPTGAKLIVREGKDTKGKVMIAVRGSDGAELSPPVAADDPTAVDRVIGQLTAWAKWFSILELTNPKPSLDVDFLVRPAAVRDPGPERSDLMLEHGDEFELVVTNRSGKGVYFAILDLSSSGKVSVVYPGEGRSEVLAHGGPPYVLRAPASVPEGRSSDRDYLKLVVTHSPVDFRFLQQNAPRDVLDRALDSDDPLVRLLAPALLVDSREVGPAKEDLEGWATSVRVLEVIRKPK